ncbi:MAG: aldo/keto reductase [Chloroflexia bacterium]
MALAWVLGRPGITSAILGASKPEQLRDSLRGVELKLDEEESAACDDVWFNQPRERDPQLRFGRFRRLLQVGPEQRLGGGCGAAAARSSVIPIN